VNIYESGSDAGTGTLDAWSLLTLAGLSEFPQQQQQQRRRRR